MKAKGLALSNSISANPASLVAGRILYVDNHLLVVDKPAGMLVQGDNTGDVSLLDAAREWVRIEFEKPGNVFLGLVHRLDRPVSGVVAFARTSKAASRLAEQFRSRSTSKIYWALVEGRPQGEGELRGRIKRRDRFARIVTEGGQEAHLKYRRLAEAGGMSLVEVELGTGRHHQIRLQFSHAGHPIVGDLRYRATRSFGNERAIALHARSLTIEHPTRDERMTFTSAPPWPAVGPWPLEK